MTLSVTGYDPDGSWQKNAATVEEITALRNRPGMTWIALDGFGADEMGAGDGPAGTIGRLAEMYRIHALTVEDILGPEQRPKVEEFEQYLFISLKAITLDADGEIRLEQVGLVVQRGTVLSFRAGSGGDPFEGIRKRILGNGTRLRRMGAGYLAYALMDAVVDEYFSVLEHIGAEMEDFEERALDDGDSEFINDIQKIKRKLLRVRRAVWPLRDSLSLMLRLDNPLLPDDMDPFYRDLYENVIQAAETLEVYRELVSGVMEVNLSAVSNRMNKVMKVLTIISTVFIPLTFVVGVYGMNFQYMPELGYRYAYPVTWIVMLLIAGGMLLFFRKRDWF
jgi:magnesium transporter